MNTKDLLNNSTVRALVPAATLGIATHTGAIVDLKGIGRKILVILNTGTPAAGGLINVVVRESNDNFVSDNTVLHTFPQINAAALVEADLSPSKPFVRVVATVSVATVPTAIIGVVYLEREVPSNL